MNDISTSSPELADLAVPRLGEVMAVNLGLPQDLSDGTRQALSAIEKRPVAGPVAVGPDGLAGDIQADLVRHGGESKAVYAYPAEHYAFWQSELGRLPAGTGVFGENLTLSGLDEHALFLGDVLRVGTAVLQVSEPRVSCFKLEIRLGQPAGFADRFIAANRVGCYFRVLRPGHVQAGDAVELIERDPCGLSVAELVRLVMLSGPADAAAIRSAAAHPHVLDPWRIRMLDRAEALDAGRLVPGWPGRRAFVIAGRRALAHEVVGLTLRPADNGSLPDYRPGQFVAIECDLGDRTVVRCYSLCEPPGRDTLQIAVQRTEPDPGGIGGVSAWLYDTVALGDRLQLRAPAGSFHADPATDRPLVLVAGGVGVTPVHAIAAAVAEGSIPRPTDVVYVASRPGADPLRDSLLALAALSPRLAVHVFYSQLDGDAAHPHRGGRPDGEFVRDLVGALDADFLLCGPSGMCQTIAADLLAAGHPPGTIRSETFGPVASHAIAGPVVCPPDGYGVSFAASGQAVRWSDPDASLLDVADAAGVTIDNSCRSGSCGSCAVRVLAGTVSYLRPPSSLVAEGECLTCLAVPAEDVELDA